MLLFLIPLSTGCLWRTWALADPLPSSSQTGWQTAFRSYTGSCRLARSSPWTWEHRCSDPPLLTKTHEEEQVLTFTSLNFTSQTSRCCWSVLLESRAQNRKWGWKARAPCWCRAFVWSFPRNAQNRCGRAEGKEMQRWWCSAHESLSFLWKLHFPQMKQEIRIPVNLGLGVINDYKQPSPLGKRNTVKHHCTCPVSLIMILSLWRSPMPRT